MSAIAAAAMRCRTMADGSLRIEVEVEPGDAQSAFALFGKPGAPVALAALLPGYAAVHSPEPEAEPGDRLSPPPMGAPKGGELSRLAGRWCQQAAFSAWLQREYPELWRACTGSLAERSAEMVRRLCLIDSRALLDHDAGAALIFHERIRRPYAEALQALS